MGRSEDSHVQPACCPLPAQPLNRVLTFQSWAQFIPCWNEKNTPTPRRRTQLQIPTPGWRKGHPCPQQGKPVSQGHYVVAGVGSNQMLSTVSERKNSCVCLPPPSHPLSLQRCSEQSDGSQKETLQPQLRPGVTGRDEEP